MSNAKEALQEALRQVQEGDAEKAKEERQALLVALRAATAATTELIAMREAEAEGGESGEDEGLEQGAIINVLRALTEAVQGLRIEAPQVDLQPQFNVPQGPAPTVNMPAIEMRPQFSVHPAEVKVIQQPAPAVNPWKKLHFAFEVTNGVIFGATVERIE